ncbi:flagellar hook-associated protein FlgK [Eubacteriales bacterium OttesenSCG-928-N14]|nr:flagellar hook-associated protein FlgK [Eubacteriales bacterium OttesenSCG-928-N14]
MSSFYGLEIGKTGLFHSKTALNLIGHNIANADTAGFTRQRIIGQNIEPASMITRFALATNETTGGGVRVQLIDQVRNPFVDRQIRSEYADLGKYVTRTEELLYVESFMNEGTDQSMSKSLSDFFDALSEFQKDPVNQEMRVVVQINAQKLVETFNHYHKQLVEAQNLYNDSINTTVMNINELADSIALYNKQIMAYELSGETALDLRDQRNLLIDELSTLVNIDYEEDELGRVNIFVGDNVPPHQLVEKSTAHHLQIALDDTEPSTGEDIYTVYMSDGVTELQYSTGSLGGYKSLRDGNTMDNIGIPYFVDQINTLAQTLAVEFNKIHERGWTMQNGSTPSEQGILFFDDLGDPTTITAANIKLSDDVKNDPFKIAASDEEIDFGASVDKRSNNKIALELLALTSSVNVPTVGNFENYLKSIVVGVGTETARSKKNMETQSAVVQNLDQRRQSVSGVSNDEEMINMVKYNHAYNAASRVITAVDEQLDQVINRMGLVGR